MSKIIVYLHYPADYAIIINMGVRGFNHIHNNFRCGNPPALAGGQLTVVLHIALLVAYNLALNNLEG